jgi:hypothetical protein
LEQRDKLISKLALENEILKKARAIVLPTWSRSNRACAALPIHPDYLWIYSELSHALKNRIKIASRSETV